MTTEDAKGYLSQREIPQLFEVSFCFQGQHVLTVDVNMLESLRSDEDGC